MEENLTRTIALRDDFNEDNLESPFDRLMGEDGRWSTEDLWRPGGYSQYRNFEKPIKEAIHAVEVTLGESAAQDHFALEHIMIPVGKGAYRKVSRYRVTRYGAYMVFGYSDKPEFKHYFATQTIQAERLPGVLASLQDEYNAKLEAVSRSQKGLLVSETIAGFEFRQLILENGGPTIPAPALRTHALSVIESYGLTEGRDYWYVRYGSDKRALMYAKASCDAVTARIRLAGRAVDDVTTGQIRAVNASKTRTITD